jgi:ribosomal peptide maturation radical SAM protein 1
MTVRILLVNMPWALLDVPSLALGILKRATARALPDARIEVLHANLEYVDWIAELDHDFGVRDYNLYSLETYFAGVGDWVFTSAMHDVPEWRVSEFAEQTALDEPLRAATIRLHRAAPAFVAHLTDEILRFAPDVVGFTSTFQQNTAVLAAARAVKAAAPHIVTVLGGANCDGEQGAAIHRNFPFVDLVVRGEGEAAFPQLLRALGGAGTLAAVPGLCWRGPDGSSTVNPMSARPLPPAAIVAPDYDEYFDRLDRSVARDWVEPKLVVEGARGCWWGQKHHCTFCGLNGSFMEFRSKSPGVFRDEILDLVRRHRVLDMFVVDNILDMNYVTSLLPMLIETGYDLRMQYEIKSNMRLAQLATLAEAGLVNVQPGIESLSTRVLKIMEKGVTGCQNIRMLRDAATAGLSVAWNYLYGFPGETADDYLPILEQFPALHHLPPLEGTARIAIERFSPYFNRPELGFDALRPAAQYRMNYDLPEAELLDLAYIFDTAPRGIDESLADRLRAAAELWQRAYRRSRLSYLDLVTEVVVVSRRLAFDWSVLRLQDPLEVAAFRLLDQPHRVPALARKLAAGAAGPARVTEATVAALLDRWVRLGLVFTDDGQFVHVVPLASNQELIRIAMADPASPEPADLAEVSA